ncbi:MAG: cell envelope integrity protein TolA [Methylophilaceae bacterium]
MRLSWLENNDNLQANLFTLVIHLALFIFMIFSVNWNVKAPYYAEIELWDAVPTQTKPKPQIKKTKPKIKKTAPSEDLKKAQQKKDADIQLKKKKAAELKKKKAAELKKKKAAELKKKKAAELKKKKEINRLQKQLLEEEKLEKIQKQLLEEEKLEKIQKQLLEEEKLEKIQKDILAQEKLERLQEDLRDKDLAKDTRIAIEGQEDLVAGSNSGELEKYKALIQQKIYQNVNKQLCGLDPVELTFEITLMPTGDLIGDAKMIKSSKIESCDLAVERAILQAQPLPLPKDNRLFSQLKKLKLKFQPNGNVD